MIALDTNILVYAFDSAYPEKREICRKIIVDIFSGKKMGVVTNQILAEFSIIVTKKIEKPLSKEDACAIIGSILMSENWKVYQYSGETVMHALTSQQPFWDALIISTLKEHTVEEILTENQRHFQNSGINVTNPFRK